MTLEHLTELVGQKQVLPVIEMEQSVISGVDDQLKQLTPDKVLKMVKEFASYKPNSQHL